MIKQKLMNRDRARKYKFNRDDSSYARLCGSFMTKCRKLFDYVSFIIDKIFHVSCKSVNKIISRKRKNQIHENEINTCTAIDFVSAFSSSGMFVSVVHVISKTNQI